MDGVLLSKQTAQRHDQAANFILGNRGAETIQTRQEVFERRGFRFYRVPAGGVAAPSSATTPTSATCTLMKWNAAGTVLSATTITETVYFFEAADADQIVKVGTIAGKNVAVGLEGAGDSDINCTFEIEIGSPDGIRPSQPTPVIRGFETQDPSKFYFDGVSPFSTVPCVIHFTGTYSFWPIRTWLRATVDSLYYWSGFQGLSGLGGRHSVRRMVQLSNRARVNRFFISLPTLVSTSDPNTTGLRQPFHIPVGFTFIADNLTGGVTRLIPDLVDEWPWPGLTSPDLEQLSLQVVAIEYNNTRISG